MGADRTWTTGEVVLLIAEAHDRRPAQGSPSALDYVPWAKATGSGHPVRHTHADVLGALVYSALPASGDGPGRARPIWHADTARAIGAASVDGYAPWAVIDPGDGSWFTCSTEGLPTGVRQHTTSLLVHLVDLDHLRRIIGGRR